jgi:hypothetical protein
VLMLFCAPAMTLKFATLVALTLAVIVTATPIKAPHPECVINHSNPGARADEYVEYNADDLGQSASRQPRPVFQCVGKQHPEGRSWHRLRVDVLLSAMSRA